MRRIYRKFYLGLLFLLSFGFSLGLSHWGQPSGSVLAQTTGSVITNTAVVAYVPPQPPPPPPPQPPPPPPPPVVVPSPPVTVPTVPVVVLPQLQIVKTVDQAAVNPGAIVNYQVVVTNVSTVVADPVTITDQLPVGFVYQNNSVQAQPNAPTQVVSEGQNLTLTFGALPPGQAITVTYQAQVTADAANGDGINTATASTPGAPPVSDTAQVTLGPLPQLEIEKTVDQTSVDPGAIVNYQVVVTNVSTVVADPVTITDQLPVGFVYQDNSVQAQPNAPTQVVSNGQNLTLTFGALPPGQAITVTYQAQVTADAANGDGINTAQVATPGVPPVSDTAQVTLGPPPQLGIEKTSDRTTTTPGEVVNYQVVVTNTSTAVANPVTITDQLPVGFVYQDNSVQAQPNAPTQVVSEGQNLTLTFGALPPGQAITVNYQVQVTADAANGDGVNTAQASAPGSPPVSANVQVPVILPELEIEKTSDRTTVAPGEAVTYQVVVTNTSTVVANPVTVSDQLPVGFVYVDGSVQTAPNPPTQVTSDGQNLTLTFGALPPGQAITINYRVQVTPNAVNGDGINTVQASTPGAPTVAANRPITVTPPPQLQIIKTSDRGAAEPGDVATYRLLVTNVGTAVADPVTITDQLPLGLRYVPDSVQAIPSPTQVTATNDTLTLTFGALAPNESISVTYAVLMTPDAVRGNGRNVATAAAPGAIPVTATAQITIRPGILADCGTIVGRVFVDKNFDGQQQPGEPGVPNAVIFMDDGNRILTDPDGLFSLVNALPGYRVGTLDLYSLPGYTLAPNLYRIEDNSVSRVARLSPGGLARMNFAVTPTFGEEQS